MYIIRVGWLASLGITRWVGIVYIIIDTMTVITSSSKKKTPPHTHTHPLTQEIIQTSITCIHKSKL